MISNTGPLPKAIASALNDLFALEMDPQNIVFEATKPEFEGDVTLVVFPFLKQSKKSPEQTAQAIGEYLLNHTPEVEKINVIKGFLNISLSGNFWKSQFSAMLAIPNFGITPIKEDAPALMVEYSSPNTNKPLHLGHIRNNLLGYSISEILKANGNKVIKANLINDRGVHICKSMLAWKKWGNNETPQSSGLKGDHLVGKYYVEFDKQLKSEQHPQLMEEVQHMLRQWENGDPEVRALWTKMNGWVYEGFEKTYKDLGVNFDKTYYESQTYLLGKELVQFGLNKQVFFTKEDGSVRINLEPDGLDEKVVLRTDGTSVYMTQDLGTAVERFKEFPNLKKLIYTVGNEQDYHFKVLFLVLNKLGFNWAKDCYHLSYGMVELPDGKMKSREGTVVDADELIAEMVGQAKAMTLALGKTEGYSNDEAEQLYHTIALGALKYFILKVDPRKKMLFNPAESIDFNGNTGPFIQYTYARIQSILRKAVDNISELDLSSLPALHEKERGLIKSLLNFPIAVAEAGKLYQPSAVANYVYELAKGYNQFYQELHILKEENAAIRKFRLALSQKVAVTIKSAMLLLGIDVPERM